MNESMASHTARETKDPEVLRYFCNDARYQVRREVAENPHTPSDVLEQMLHGEDAEGGRNEYFTAIIAGNPYYICMFCCHLCMLALLLL